MEIAKNNDPVVAQVSHDDDRKATATDESIQRMTEKKNLIKVSYHKKPFNYYLNLAKAYRYIKEYNDVELSALGNAIPTAVAISEILRRNGLASQKGIRTSTVHSKMTDKGRLHEKAKIEIVMEKAEKLDKTTTVAASKKAADTNA